MNGPAKSLTMVLFRGDMLEEGSAVSGTEAGTWFRLVTQDLTRHGLIN